LNQQINTNALKNIVMKTLTTILAALIVTFSASARNLDSTGTSNDKKETRKATVTAPAFVWGNADEMVKIKIAAPEFNWGDAAEQVVITRKLAPEFSFGEPVADTKALKDLPAKRFAAPAFVYGNPEEEVKIAGSRK
jgi:hypothetical protein